MTRLLLSIAAAVVIASGRARADDDAAFVAANLRYSREFYSYVHLVAIAKSPRSFAYDRYPNGPERIRCDAGTYARQRGKPWVKSQDWAESGAPVNDAMARQLDGCVALVDAALNVAPAAAKLASKSEEDARTQWVFDVRTGDDKSPTARLRFAKPLFDHDDDVLLHGFTGQIRQGNEKAAKPVEFSFGYLVNIEGGYELSERAWEDMQAKNSDAAPAPNPPPTDSVAYLERAKARWKRGDVGGATVDLNRAVERDPKNPAAYYERGVARRVNHDMEGAIADLSRAVDLAPGNGDAYNERGIARRNKGDFDGAIADYTRAIELEPKTAEFAYYNRALAHEAKKDGDAALADYTKVIELDEKNANAFRNRGDLKLSKKDADGAIADFTRAIELNPKLAAAYQHRAEAKRAKGDADGAAADLKQAAEINGAAQ